ncbi:MAG: chromosome segregation protein SMC [Planctomycetota bacterium]
MRLTRVEIHGFKSFADRTQLDFPPGLTAVVGPNGCGKSNVIDAIKWALGEQRASALRGDEMLDVIFKGNGARPPRNFAEVSLVFDNHDHTLPLEFEEVVVSRRLFRSGESEYLVNRQPVRLKDVRDLFMDTGLGTGAYSIMEQGRIDAVLSADPEDRRRIFEEAAGISRYRTRRRESESKLERTEQNLLRLSDILDEIEKQLRSLKNQAGRARSFLTARDRLRELRSGFSRHRWQQLGRQAAEAAEREAQLAAAEGRARERLEAARAGYAVLNEGIQAARAEVDQAAEAFRRSTSATDALAGRRSSLRERLGEGESRLQLLADRVSGLEMSLAQRQTEVQELSARLMALQAERGQAEGRATAHDAEQKGAEQALAAWRTAGEERRRVALERLNRLTECSNVRAEAASRCAAVEAGHRRVSERAAILGSQLQEHGLRQGELSADVSSLATTLGAAQAELDQRRAQRSAAQQQLDEVDARLSLSREKLAAVESRRQALEEMIARREGLSPGARTLLDSGLPGISGLVVDCLRAPRKISEAVEAALGATAEAVLVDTRAAALAALEHLSASGAGRVLLLPRDGMRSREGAVGGERLLDRIEVRAEREVLTALLGHVRLVKDREALRQCALDGVTVWVTPQGDLLDERGVLRGGRVGGEGGLVTRRAECETLGEEAAALRQQLEADGLSRREQGAGLERHASATEAAEQELRRLEGERARVAERQQQSAARQLELQREQTLVEKDLSRLAEELAREASARDRAAASERELEALVTADRDGEQAGEAQRATLETALEARRAAAAEARLQLSALTERREALDTETRQVARAIEERRAELSVAQREVDEQRRLAEALRGELASLDESETRLVEEREVTAGRLEAARAAAAEAVQSASGAQQDVVGCETALEQAAGRHQEEQLKLRECELHRQALREKVQEELSIDLAAEAESAAASGESDAPPDWTAVEAEIEELRDRMSRMGNVNLEAVDELVQVEERFSFLASQRDDLLSAKSSLLETIAKVDGESRERFLASFVEIREHFRQIFRKLFRGGKADIVLAEGQDVLEAGIEIIAAPPGKDARSITLLSGGERTLTAVGLLFALFRAKPSPVCMLDEVDAALDETNIDRFCTVLEDFLGGSQFVVVTHARRTMSYAGTLYGITMQEHGVSRALSLTLGEYEAERGVRSPGATAESNAEAEAPAGQAAPKAVRPRAAVAAAADLAAGGRAALVREADVERESQVGESG